MEKFDKMIFGFTLLGFSLSMMTISLDTLEKAGVNFSPWTLYVLGISSAIFTFIFIILGIIILAKKDI